MSNDQSTLGAFEIVSKIGSGGMATVYKAYQPKLDRHVAVKVMHPSIASDGNFLARFEREARIVAKLDHPHIVPVYDFDNVDGQPFLVMKYIDGRTLKDILRDGPMQPSDVTRIIGAIGDALDYAHEKGILHRDIKPSNIIIDGRGYPYLTDFGLARVAQQGESTMSIDVMLGTPHYISPEQARGNTDLDSRTDVYSLGIVLYELLTGRLPFTGDSSYAIVHAQINEPPPPPRQINPAIPEEVEAVLLKALAKDRTERYATPGALIAAYEQAMAGQQVSAPSSQVIPKESTPAGMDSTEEHSFLIRIKKWGDNLEGWGREMEKQFADFEEGVPDKDKPREAWRRARRAWKDSMQAREEGRVVEARIEATAGMDKSEVKKVKKEMDSMDEFSHLPPEERIRRRLEARIEKHNEERGSLLGHIFFFFLINMVLCNFGPWLTEFASGNLTMPNIITLLWGIGLIAHVLTYLGEWGPGAQRRQRRIDNEVARQMRMFGYMQDERSKRKNEELAYERGAMRLTDEGEFTESFVDDIAGSKRKNT